MSIDWEWWVLLPYLWKQHQPLGHLNLGAIGVRTLALT